VICIARGRDLPASILAAVEAEMEKTARSRERSGTSIGA
jgi:hypothetical protein